MKYSFTFDRLTNRDFVAIAAFGQTNDFAAFMQVVDKCTVGGVLDLPFESEEFNSLIQQFATAAKEYFERKQTASNDLLVQAMLTRVLRNTKL